MKFGITAKLFLTIFATCMLVLVTMHWGGRVGFERGFIDYIRQGNEQRLTLISEGLAEQYIQNGNWQFLRNNERMVYRLMHNAEMNGDDGRGSLPREWRTQFWVTDAKGNRLLGPQGPTPRETVSRPILVNNATVGWVISTPIERLTRNADISFAHRQSHISGLIAGLVMLLAAAVAWLIARSLLAPVQRLIVATHHLAAGDFTTRVPPGGHDELGRLARDFNQLAITLEKNEHIRRALVADVSHELRTPLAILRGELEALQDAVRPLTADALTSLQSEVLILNKLVDDLHQLSLSDVGALAYRKESLDAVQLLQLSLAAFRERFNEKQIALRSHLPASAMLFGDPSRLTQLFHNLLENSLRYTDHGGVLEVGIQPQDDGLLFYWQDSAPGVSDEQLTQIFERFYRTEGSRNRASGGSGLGLAISQNIVEAHGGQMVAQHSPLGGLRIAILLPNYDSTPYHSELL